MAICIDCIHRDVCRNAYTIKVELPNVCGCFRNRADYHEIRHGEWKRNERNIPKMREFHEKGIALSMNEKSIFYTCTCCGSWGSLSDRYCSYCGAKMRGVEDA